VLLAASSACAPAGGRELLALSVPSLVQATAAHALGEAVGHNRLGSDTYRRLASGLLLSSVLTLAVAATSGATPTAWPAVVAACSAACCVAAYRADLGATLRSLLPLSWALASARLLSSKTYALVGTATAITAAALVAAPTAVLEACGIGAEASATGVMAMARCFGAAAATWAVVLFVLADAADRQRLGGSTFRHLNAACATAATLGGALLVAAANAAPRDGVLMGLALLQITPAALCLFQFLTATKPSSAKKT
jgi:hypothetical protein